MPLRLRQSTLCSFLYPPGCGLSVFDISRTASPGTAIQARKSSSRFRTRTRPPVKREVQRDPATIPESEFPHDFGLFPGTLVMPTGPRKPSILFSPIRRAKLEWYRLKQRPVDLYSLFGYKFGHAKGKRPKLEPRKLVPTALALHQRMYTATAEGDKAALKEICCEGLLKQLTGRISSRSPNESTLWTLHKYVGISRVVSNRASSLPRKDSALRQVVVKVKSKQSLALTRAGGINAADVPKGTDEVKDMTEYIVLQRRIFEGVEGPWKVWGTMQEADPDEVLGKPSSTSRVGAAAIS